jgi:uncharacterized protein (TIRG00374 family)
VISSGIYSSNSICSEVPDDVAVAGYRNGVPRPLARPSSLSCTSSPNAIDSPAHARSVHSTPRHRRCLRPDQTLLDCRYRRARWQFAANLVGYWTMQPVGRVASRLFVALRRPRIVLRLLLILAVVVFLVRPLIPRVGSAADQLEVINPWLTGLGFALQVVALFCYSVMTRVALGDERTSISVERLFRIQLVTRAVSSTVPGGAAAGPTVGYRLITSAGVSGQKTSAALASGSVTSALMLNLLLWGALVVSIPSYGFNAIYAGAALLSIILMLVVAGVFVSIVDGSRIVQRPVRFVARRVGADPERVTRSIRTFGEQIETLVNDRPLIARLSFWATANWLLDALSLWVFLRAFGVTLNPIGLLVAFGVANVLAAIPISPGGLGIVEWAYIPILVTFGATLEQATIAVTSYRVAQFLFPIVLGGLSYASLTAGSYIKRRRNTAAPELA